MATRPKGSRKERTRSNDAGKPVTRDTTRAPRSGPTDEELDRRDRMKSGPRRPAGPPLAGDTAEPGTDESASRQRGRTPNGPHGALGERMPLTLVQNIGLDDTATSNRTSSICEPTVAANTTAAHDDGQLVRLHLCRCRRKLDIRRPVHPLSGIGRRLLLRPGGLVQPAPPHLDLAFAVHRQR